jgi:hypothetical protein
MRRSAASRERQHRQTRVAMGTWGAICMIVGGAFMLESLGQIDLSGPVRYDAGKAFDGDPATRWSSSFKTGQSITVDLGERTQIARVKLNWESARAKNYEIQVSDDGTTFTTAKTVEDGQGSVDDLEVSAEGRYVRMFGSKRATQYGFSLFEMEVFGPTGRQLSEGKPATASSVERTSPWVVFWGTWWPLFLLGWGLPGLLVPKDSGEQAFGLFLTGAGVFFFLQRMGYLRWSFSQVWPVLLIAAGLLMVAQAIRQATAAPTGDDATPRP